MIWRCFTSKFCKYIIIILSLPRHISAIVFSCNLHCHFFLLFINFSLYTQNKGKTKSLPFIFRLLLSLKLSVFFHLFFPSASYIYSFSLFCISFTIIFSLFISFVHFPSVAPFFMSLITFRHFISPLFPHHIENVHFIIYSCFFFFSFVSFVASPFLSNISLSLSFLLAQSILFSLRLSLRSVCCLILKNVKTFLFTVSKSLISLAFYASLNSWHATPLTTSLLWRLCNRAACLDETLH